MSETVQTPPATSPKTLSGLVSDGPPKIGTVKPNARYGGKFPLEIAQEKYIEYCAASGMRLLDDGTFVPIGVLAFAAELGVDVTTLYYWKRSIPEFRARVDARRKELNGGTRTDAVWKAVMLSAMAGKPESQKIWLKNHDPNYIDPAQKVEHDIGAGLADLLQKARQGGQLPSRTVIEGEASATSSNSQ